MDINSFIELVSRYKIFEDLTTQEMSTILSCAEELFFPKDAPIFHESNLSLDLYIILLGEVVIKIEPRHYNELLGDKQILAVLSKGDIFGEMAFLRGQKRSAHVKTTEKSHILKIDGLQLYDIFEKNLRIAYIVIRNIAMILAERLENINLRWQSENESISVS